MQDETFRFGPDFARWTLLPPPPPPVRFKTMVYILSCLQRNWFQLWQFKSNDKRKKEIRKTGKDLIYFILLFKYWFVRIFHSFPLPFPFPPPPPRFSHSDKLFEYSEAVIVPSERIQNSTDSVWMHDLILIDLPSIYTLIVQQRLRFSPSLFLFLNLFEIHQQEITWWFMIKRVMAVSRVSITTSKLPPVDLNQYHAEISNLIEYIHVGSNQRIHQHEVVRAPRKVNRNETQSQNTETQKEGKEEKGTKPYLVKSN